MKSTLVSNKKAEHNLDNDNGLDNDNSANSVFVFTFFVTHKNIFSDFVIQEICHHTASPAFISASDILSSFSEALGFLLSPLTRIIIDFATRTKVV